MKGKRNPRTPVAALLLAIFAMVAFWGCAEPSLERIEVTPEELTLLVGESANFQATPLSGQDEEMPEVTIQWSVEGEAGSIDQNGLFMAQEPGEALIMATGDGITGNARVTVNPVPPATFETEPEETVALPSSEITVRIKALTADAEPAGYNEVTLSTPTEGASLSDETLVLSPSGEGEFVVTLSPEPGMNVIVLQSGEVTEELRIEATRIVRLEIRPRDTEFEAGQEITFEAIGLDEHGNQTSITPEWSISGEIAEIKEESTVLMREPGRGILLAKYQDATQGHPFVVTAGEVARLQLEPSSAELEAGQSVDFHARGFNAQDFPIPVQVQWAVEGDVGSIAQDGTFLARIAGEGAVQATFNEITAEAPVAVEHGPLAAISVDIAEHRLTAGETLELRAEGMDAFGNRFSVSPQWSLSRSLGTIDQQESTFTPLHAGSGDIRAAVGNILTSVEVEVEPAELARLEILPQSVDMIAGERIQLEVKGFDRFGNPVEVEPTFSMEEPLGELDPSGEFRAERAGSTVMRASVDDLSAEGTLAVAPAEVVEVVVEPEGPVELVAGRTQSFKAFGFDQFGNTVESTTDWRIHPDLGTVDEQGVLFPRMAGKGEVIASLTQTRTGKAVESKTPVSVVPGETTAMEIRPTEIQTTAGKETPFVANTYDQFGNETSVPLQWKLIEPDMGTISENGLFLAMKAGTGKVLAQYENVTAEASVEISPAEIAFLQIVPEELSLTAGEKVQLKALGEDPFGNVVDAHVRWTLSDTSLGSIGPDNVLTAQRSGKGQVIATSRNIVDLASLEVKAGPMVSLEVRPTEMAVRSGESYTFQAVGLDVAGNPLEVTPQWNVEEQLGTIQQNGVFTARTVGTGEVSATFQDFRSASRVEVLHGAPASIEVEPAEITLTAGSRQEFSFQVFDVNGNAIPRPELQWEMERGLGRFVDDNEFHAEKVGEEIIRITSQDVTVQVPVTIQVGKVHTVHVEPSEADLTAGEKTVFTAKALDAEGNEVPTEPAWAVGGGVGSITAEGVFEAIRAGRGHVSFKVEDVIGVAPVSVQPGSLARIAVTPEKSTVRAGETVDFTATALDAQGNVTSGEFTWSMEPAESGQAVTAEGSFQMTRAGESQVVARAEGIEGRARVYVEPGAVEDIHVSPEEIRLTAAEVMEVTVSGRDTFGNEVALSPEFSLSPPEIGSITEEGVFTAQEPGEGQLTVSAQGVQATVPLEVTVGELMRLSLRIPHEDLVAGKSYQFEAVGHDRAGNEIPVDVEWAVTEDIGRIEMTSGLFHATKAGRGMLVAYGQNLIVEKPIEVKPGEIHRLFIEPNPVDVRSNSTQTFEVTALDVEENPVPVEVSALTWNQVGNIGVFEEPGVFRGTRMGKGKVTATLAGLVAEAYVTVVPGRSDPGNTRIRVLYPILASDGEASSEIIVEVRDLYNNPVTDVEVTLVSTRQVDTVVQPPPTNERGLTRGRISSTESGTSIVSAVIQGQTMRDTARVTFE